MFANMHDLEENPGHWLGETSPEVNHICEYIVRREKALIFSGRDSRPATVAPAGGNRTVAEATKLLKPLV